MRGAFKDMKLMNKQKNCPYCHEQFDSWGEPIVGDLNDIGCGLKHVKGVGWYMESWDYDVVDESNKTVVACPMCGRSLENEANR